MSSADAAAPDEPHVLVGHEGHALRITLNRPRALNALTLGMVGDIDRALDEAEADDQMRVVIFDGAGDRGFCAGGDIRAIYDSARAGDDTALVFWAEEYRLNARIAGFTKPIVAIMDGIVMGGGVGLAGHASHRVVTERSRVAMPEVGIGYVPDVGGTWLLTRRAGELGTHAALTTAHLNAADAIAVGMADRFVPSDQLSELIAALASSPPDEVLGSFSVTPPPADFATPEQLAWIDTAYAHDDVATVVEQLRATGGAAAAAADEIAKHSPTALAVTLAALRSARTLPNLESCLEQDFRVSRTFLREIPDFVEGVRAAIVDKDRMPKWQPDRQELVSPETIQRCFAPMPDDLILNHTSNREVQQ